MLPRARTPRTDPSRRSHLSRLRLIATLALLAGSAIASAAGAGAHGFSSVVFADLTAPEPGVVRAELGLEYDLLVVSVADAERDDPLYRAGTAAFDDADPIAAGRALTDHRDSVLTYLADRFEITTAEGAPCTPQWDGRVRMDHREGVPYAFLNLDYACTEHTGAHRVTSTLFPDDEEYVTGTKVVVAYDLDQSTGSAALGTGQPSFSTAQPWTERFTEFFLLGAEHLLFGLDHILFLLAVIVGSRRLREIVLSASAFTVAHSITFILAATGLVHVSAAVVEPIIAASIAVVAGWHLWRVRRDGVHAADITPGGRLGLDRAGWVRVAVVLLFGLVHGLGFAGALGIDQPWSWTLLWSLLVFNIGIEAVQLAIIAVLFPMLALMRRRTPRAETWVTGVIATAVAAMGLIWLFQRALGG